MSESNGKEMSPKSMERESDGERGEGRKKINYIDSVHGKKLCYKHIWENRKLAISTNSHRVNICSSLSCHTFQMNRKQ